LENSEKENSCLTLIELEHELKKLHFSLSRHWLTIQMEISTCTLHQTTSMWYPYHTVKQHRCLLLPIDWKQGHQIYLRDFGFLNT